MGEPDITQRIHYEPAPEPLPTNWARTIANDIASRLTHEGWQPEAKLRAWSATGNPSGHRYHPSGAIPGVLPTTELISNNLYTWGSIDPHDYPGLDLPPLVYTLKQLDLAYALGNQPNPAPLIHAAQAWLDKCRRSPRKHETTPHRHRHPQPRPQARPPQSPPTSNPPDIRRSRAHARAPTRAQTTRAETLPPQTHHRPTPRPRRNTRPHTTRVRTPQSRNPERRNHP